MKLHITPKLQLSFYWERISTETRNQLYRACGIRFFKILNLLIFRNKFIFHKKRNARCNANFQMVSVFFSFISDYFSNVQKIPHFIFGFETYKFKLICYVFKYVIVTFTRFDKISNRKSHKHTQNNIDSNISTTTTTAWT